MSGGEYDYLFSRVEEVASKIPLEGKAYCASPELRQRFKEHLVLVVEVLKAIEYNDSGDGDEGEATAIQQCLGDYK